MTFIGIFVTAVALAVIAAIFAAVTWELRDRNAALATLTATAAALVAFIYVTSKLITL